MDRDRNHEGVGAAVAYGGTIKDAAGHPVAETGPDDPGDDAAATVESQIDRVLPQGKG